MLDDKSQRWVRLALLAAVATFPLTWAGGAEPTPAKRIAIVPSPFTDLKLAPATDGEAGFVLTLKRDMPTPGWQVTVDEVDIDVDAGRITVRLTDAGPKGMVAQVITPTTFTVPLGALPKGTWVLEVHGRRKVGAPHRVETARIVKAF